MDKFQKEVAARIAANGLNESMIESGRAFMRSTIGPMYSYNFSWQGRPVIQYPQDLIAMQELVWSTNPDLIIETGIAHGGSLIFSASLLALRDMADAVKSGTSFNPKESKRKVLGIDIDIRDHNRAAIESHPLASRIQMIQGSSISPDVITQVRQTAQDYRRILVCLDSNHTHDHVLAELEAYAPLTTMGSYCVVFDTIIEDLPAGMFPNRPWGHGDNPKTAVRQYLRRLNDEGRSAADGKPLAFEIDKTIDNKLLISVAPDGYLRRIDK